LRDGLRVPDGANKPRRGYTAVAETTPHRRPGWPGGQRHLAGCLNDRGLETFRVNHQPSAAPEGQKHRRRRSPKPGLPGTNREVVSFIFLSFFRFFFQAGNTAVMLRTLLTETVASGHGIFFSSRAPHPPDIVEHAVHGGPGHTSIRDFVQGTGPRSLQQPAK